MSKAVPCSPPVMKPAAHPWVDCINLVAWNKPCAFLLLKYC